jgi:DNA polymerase III epsilon subunit-like protein
MATCIAAKVENGSEDEQVEQDAQDKLVEQDERVEQDAQDERVEQDKLVEQVFKLNMQDIGILFIDLETNGLPTTKNWHNYYPFRELQYYETSRVIQIAVKKYVKLGDEKMPKKKSINISVCDDKRYAVENKYVLVESHDYIISPDGFKIENTEFHSITQDIAKSNGIPFKRAIEKIKHLFRGVLIAHNIKFDSNVLLSEMFRYGLYDQIAQVENMNQFCTSYATAPILQICRLRNGDWQHIKLIHWYQRVVGKAPEKMHNAEYDVYMLATCFFSYLEKGIFVANEI